MLTSAFTVFWITITVVLSVDFVATIILCAIENKLKNKHPDNEGAIKVEQATTRVKGEEVYLKAEGGVVTIIDELPTVEVQTEVVKEVEKETAAPAGKGEPIYIKVEDGVVTVINELPTIRTEVIKEVEVAVPAEQQEAVEPEQETPVEDEIAADLDENEEGRVVFIANEDKLTFLAKLAAMPEDIRALYDDLVSYINQKDGIKRQTTNNKDIFKVKTDRLLTASVRRNVINLQFNLINSSLERYMKAESVKDIKVPPVVIRLTDETALAQAKSTADLTLAYIEQEREYNAEQRKAARREARRAKAEAARAAADNDAE